MKKGFSILFAWLITTAIVTVGGVLPHHHEANGGICFATEHTHSHSAQDQEGCPLEEEFVASLQHSASEEHGSRCGLCDHNHSGDHQSLLLFSVNALNLAPIIEGRRIQTTHEPHTPLILASWAKGVSLRAPPVC